MKKLSSKIIISLVLATILWSGVSFDFGINNKKLEIKVEKAYAAELRTEAECNLLEARYNASWLGKENLRIRWEKCEEELAKQHGIETLTEKDFKELISQQIGMISEGEKIAIAAHAYCTNKNVPKEEILNCTAIFRGTYFEKIADKRGNLGVTIDRWLDGLGSFIDNAAIDILAGLLYIILTFANWLLALAGNLFDSSINLSILKLSSYEDILTAINEVWVTIRNVINITFIFILLWISIKTILGLTGADTKKMLSSVIISALLINFSLFVTKIIIDAGNMVATSLYDIALQDDTIRINPTREKYISNTIFKNLGLTTLYIPKTTENSKTTDSKSIIMMIARIILSFITAWAFFYASFLFIVRMVAFFILMILSPVGFIGGTIPYFKTHSKKWWETLINQSLVAPVFLFFIILIIKISSAESFHIKTAGLSQISVTNYLNFALIISLIIASVKITKKLSGEAGSMMTSRATSALGMGLGLASGGAASLLRNTVGKRASEALEGEKGDALRERAKQGGISGATARMQLRAANTMSKSNFDARSTKAGGLLKKAGVDTNKGLSIQKGGVSQIKKDAEKEAEEKAKLYSGDVSDEHYQKVMDSAAEKRSEVARLRNVATRTKKEEDTMQQHIKDIAEHDKKFSGINDAKDKKAFVKQKIKEDRIEAAAQREERKDEVRLPKILGGKKIINAGYTTTKARAAKIRKSIKEKTSAETWQEMIKKEAEEQRKKDDQATTTPPPNTKPTS